jgi:hypothetical protein
MITHLQFMLRASGTSSPTKSWFSCTVYRSLAKYCTTWDYHLWGKYPRSLCDSQVFPPLICDPSDSVARLILFIKRTKSHGHQYGTGGAGQPMMAALTLTTKMGAQECGFDSFACWFSNLVGSNAHIMSRISIITSRSEHKNSAHQACKPRGHQYRTAGAGPPLAVASTTKIGSKKCCFFSLACLLAFKLGRN